MISPSGRTCWIGLRVDQYEGCKWFMTDSKHIEKYWTDFRDDEYSTFIYEAKPNATFYTRICKSPKEVINDFCTHLDTRNYEDHQRELLEWTNNYNIKVSKIDNFPETYNTKKEKIGPSMYHSTMPELEEYNFQLTRL